MNKGTCVERYRTARALACSMFKPTLSGLTCLSSPTTRICFARKSAGRADKVDWEASSTMTKSKIPSSAGRDSDTRLCGMIKSEEHTSELQSLMRSSYAVFCMKKKKDNKIKI